MAFHFTLQPVLNFRKSIERRRELLLQQASVEVARVEQQRRDVEQAMVSFNQDEAAALKPGLHAAELQWDGMQRFALRAHREWLEQKCTEAVNKRASCMADFQKARQERESLERLRQQQWEIYQNEAARLEQRRLDDLFLARQFSADRSHHQS